MKENEDEKNIKETKQAIMEAQEKLEQISQDEHERYLAELREKYVRDQQAVQEYGYIKGREEGREEGKREGKEEEKIEIAKKMLKKGEKIEYIIEITGLTKEEIESWLTIKKISDKMGTIDKKNVD